MKSALKVLQEQIQYFYLIRRLSIFELRSKNSDNYLGMAWELINPIFQISIYWFIFGYGIRQRADMEITEIISVPFIYWMIIGMVVWLFFYQSIIQGSKAIYTRIKMLAKMNFPMSIITHYIVLGRYFVFLGMFILLVIIMNVAGYKVNVYYLQLPYFLFALFAFTFSLAFVMSTLSTIIRDIQMFLQAVLRMGLYVSPILWDVESIGNETVSFIIKLNPLFYIIEGFRASFFNVGWYFNPSGQEGLFFWIITLLLFMIGSVLHLRFRRHFIDFV